MTVFCWFVDVHCYAVLFNVQRTESQRGDDVVMNRFVTDSPTDYIRQLHTNVYTADLILN